MTEAAKEKRRAYQRKWRKENPDKVRANTERYWERQAAKDSQKAAEGEGAATSDTPTVTG